MTDRWQPTSKERALVSRMIAKGATWRQIGAAVGHPVRPLRRAFSAQFHARGANTGSQKFIATEDQKDLVYEMILEGATQSQACAAIGVGVTGPAFDRELREIYRSALAKRREMKAADRAEREALARAARKAIPRTVRPKAPPQPPSLEDVAIVERMIREGATQWQVAKALGTAEDSKRFTALRPVFSRLRPERVSAKFVPTAEQRATAERMIAEGANRSEVAIALGRSPQGTSSVTRAFRAELVARKPERVPCFVCGAISADRLPGAQTCDDEDCQRVRKNIHASEYRSANLDDIRRKNRIHSRLTYFPGKHAERDRLRSEHLRAITQAFQELGILPEKAPPKTSKLQLDRSRAWHRDHRVEMEAYYQANRSKIIEASKRRYRQQAAILAVFNDIQPEEGEAG